MFTASASNVYVLIPAVFIMTLFLGIRWYYLKTSREIKRLEAVGKKVGSALCMAIRNTLAMSLD